MLSILNLTDLEAAFDRCISQWHEVAEPIASVLGVTVNPLALELMLRNHLLWHEEDKARRTDVTDSVIALVKRNIDRFNQQRNDLIEQLDEAIMSELLRTTPELAAETINSETPGSIVDRISILSLKIFHMDEDSRRDDIEEQHRQKSLQRLAVLRQQRSDLYGALAVLLDEYRDGRKRMKLYKQFKMYNDPTLNPEIYRTRPSPG